MRLFFITFFSSLLTLIAQPKNILFIVSEDNGPELSCYGEPYVKTPNLDQLAQNGIRFERAYVPQAGCSQSRAAFLTGLYPHQNGQIGLATWKFSLYQENTPNMAKHLKKAGYHTGIIGKLHVNPESTFPFDKKVFSSSNFSRKNLHRYAQEAALFFKESAKPFFLQINYPDAHRPFITQKDNLPTKVLKGKDVLSLKYFGLDNEALRQQTADYYNCIMRLDALIGDLLKELKASGKYDQTIIVYIGDHGADLLRGKRTCYEGGTRIPMIISGPTLKKEQVRNELVSTIDLFPTFIEISQLKSDTILPGNSLIPLLKGESPQWREFLFTEFHLHSAHNYFPQRAICNDRFKLIESLIPNSINPGYDFTLNKFFKQGFLESTIAKAPQNIQQAYQNEKQPPQYLLYDLQNDPYEFNNLANNTEHQDIKDQLIYELSKWRTQTNDPLLNTQNTLKLQHEISKIKNGNEYSKGKITSWNYSNYFFKK